MHEHKVIPNGWGKLRGSLTLHPKTRRPELLDLLGYARVHETAPVQHTQILQSNMLY